VANKHIFDIPFVGLKQGVHIFEYVLDEKFFVEKNAIDFANATANVKLSLEKNKGFMLLKFEVGGDAVVTCDRCGNALKIDLWDEFKIVVKLVDDPDGMNLQEEDPDIHYISRSDSHLDVSDLLYEFAMLSVPMQKMCKEEERGGPKCNNENLQKLAELNVVPKENNAGNLWKDLEKFKLN